MLVAVRLHFVSKQSYDQRPNVVNEKREKKSVILIVGIIPFHFTTLQDVDKERGQEIISCQTLV